MNIIFKNSETFVIRQPYYPLNNLVELVNSSNKALNLFNSEDFKRAILWVSSDLYSEYMRFLRRELNEKESDKIFRTLLKYAIRMSSRSTPFGEFASIGTGIISDYNKLNHQGRCTRFVYLDANLEHDMLFQIYENEFKYNKNQIQYALNGSIIRKGSQFLYIRKSKSGRLLSCSIEYNQIIAYLLKISKKLYTYNELKQILLKKYEIDDASLEKFIDLLKKNSILIQAIRPEAMEKTWLNRILPVLSEESTKIVENCLIDLKQIEKNDSVGFLEEKLKGIRSSQYSGKKEYKNIVQTIRYTNSLQKLEYKTIEKIINSIDFFSRISHRKSDNNNLSRFKQEFQNRYESQSVPLIEVLNPEIGIGYANTIYPEINPLLMGLKSEEKDFHSNVLLDPFELILQRKIKENKEGPIRICKEDVKHLVSKTDLLPATISAIFNISGVDNTIISELHFSGSSATCLLGRFTLGNRNIRKLVNNIALFEDSYYKKFGRISEINLLPNIRCGNVNYRSRFRKHRICCYYGSKKSDIVLRDIMVSVINNQVILTDKKSGKRIIPRLSSAHNNYAGTDAIYQFLGDIQCQLEITSMMFSWGNLRRFYNHFPRVYYNDIVISLEEWSLNTKEIIKDKKVSLELLKKWSSDNTLPRFIKLIDGDNELVTDLESDLSLKIFTDEIKNRDTVILRECIETFHSGNLKNQYCNQVILPIFKYIENEKDS